MVSLLSRQYHLSKRESEGLLGDFFGVDLALGSIPALEQRTSQALAEPVEQAREYVRQQSVIHLDETGWPEGFHRGWLWVAATSLVTVYLLAASRGRQVAQTILGLDFSGIVVSDRWSAYNWWLSLLCQLCWAHLRRDFQAFIDRGGQSQEIGQALLSLSNLMFQWWHAIRDGTMDGPTF
jgi:transposase